MRIRLLLLLVVSCVVFACEFSRASDLALVGGKIYLSPDEKPIETGLVVVHQGRIVAVGPSATVKLPRDAKVIDCRGLVVTAGFWNSHVHILLPGLLHVEKLSPEQISSQLQEMLTRWGFTTVFDLASVQANTNLIRRLMENGKVKGPRILTVGEPFWIKTPVYVRDFLEKNDIRMPIVQSARQATERVRKQVGDGADGIKIFANSVEADGIVTMPLDLAKAITVEAHRAGKPVFAHVSNREGIEVALQSGVDVLAHTTPVTGAWDASLVARMISAHVALTPTLTLWDSEFKTGSREKFEKLMNDTAVPQLRAFSEAGGQVLFGTDVGYTQRFNTTEEFLWMSRAGMTFEQILASLTTSPAERFGYSQHSGRISNGMDADLVVLGADPKQDVTAFSRVRYTIRHGMIIYAEK